MSVLNLELVSDLAADFFGEESCFDSDSNCITVSFSCHGILTQVFFEIDDTQPKSEQYIQILYCFDYEKMPAINTKLLEWTEILKICHTLQRFTCWSTIMPVRDNTNSNRVNMSMHRYENVSKLERSPDLIAEVRSLLEHLTDEWERLGVIFYGMATEQIVSEDNAFQNIMATRKN